MNKPAGETVLRSREGRVGVLTLNRPEARNALNLALLTELETALEEMAADPDIGAIVLTGAGSAFCAGADLKEGAEQSGTDDFWTRHERTTRSMRIHQILPRLAKPVIAAVNGAAVAGGCGVAMSCDLVVASDHASFGYPEVGKGLVAAMVMVSLSRLAGRRQALDLLLTGRRVSAEEALALGLVNRVVPHEQLLPEVMAYAGHIASNSPSALRITKDLFHQVTELDYDRALEHARDVNLMVRQTSDARRGITTFASGESAGQ